MATSPVAEQFVRKFRSRVLLPVVLVTLGAVFLAAFGLYWATSRSDAIAVARQVRETRHAIQSSIDELPKHQRIVAAWDELALQLAKPAPDWQWVNAHLGLWLHDLFGHNRAYILDGDDRPVYAMVDGAQVEAASGYDLVRAQLQHLVDSLRGRLADTNDIHSPPARRPLPSRDATRSDHEVVYNTDLISIFGYPVVASVMRIVSPKDPLSRTPSAEHLLISVQLLERSFLQELSTRNLIDGLRFARVAHLEKGEQALPLESNDGALIGHLIWKPELPGTALMRTAAPGTALAIAAMIAIMTLLARRLHWSICEQQATMDELHTTLNELRASESQSLHIALHDVLTGLPNRAKFNERLDQALAGAKRGVPVAILLLDLDRFKQVNDTLGHVAGDRLIGEFAGRLSELVGAGEVVSRLGGDEFAILTTEAASPHDVEALCQRIFEAVRRPFQPLGNSIFIGVSIGVAIAPETGSDAVDLMRKADIALYRAKAEGRDCYRVFTEAMDESVKMRGTVEEELRAALAAGQGLLLHYQPQVSCRDETIVGLEALVRWQHPTRGLVPPQQFISVAEETGLICQLGDWVLREACTASRRWPNLFMAVNFSPTQFRATGFVKNVMDIVRDCGADPRQIELEVTESVLLDDNEFVRDALRELRAAGFRVALDDFGTGYSSLSYLRRFEVDKIKIDRSFVQHLWHAVDSVAIVTAVLTLGHAMGLQVTAEGVETAEQRHFLKAVGCDTMQGFLFSRPLPETEIAVLIAARIGAKQGARGVAVA